MICGDLIENKNYACHDTSSISDFVVLEEQLALQGIEHFNRAAAAFAFPSQTTYLDIWLATVAYRKISRLCQISHSIPDAIGASLALNFNVGTCVRGVIMNTATDDQSTDFSAKLFVSEKGSGMTLVRTWVRIVLPIFLFGSPALAGENSPEIDRTVLPVAVPKPP